VKTTGKELSTTGTVKEAKQAPLLDIIETCYKEFKQPIIFFYLIGE
jgi:hypothetical protein